MSWLDKRNESLEGSSVKSRRKAHQGWRRIAKRASRCMHVVIYQKSNGELEKFLRDFERNSIDLERNSMDFERNSKGLSLKMLAQDGRRALEIYFIVFHNEGFDDWA